MAVKICGKEIAITFLKEGEFQKFCSKQSQKDFSLGTQIEFYHKLIQCLDVSK